MALIALIALVSVNASKDSSTVKVVIVAMIATAISAGIVACGSDGDRSSSSADATGREAAASSCPEKKSDGLSFPVTNYLEGASVQLRGYNVDCSDWSGVSTPSNAFDNLRLAPGETKRVRLEVSSPLVGEPTRLFNLAISLVEGSLYLGDARLEAIPPLGLFLRGPAKLEPLWACDRCFMALQPTGEGPTDLKKVSIQKKGLGIIVYQGKIGVATNPLGGEDGEA